MFGLLCICLGILFFLSVSGINYVCKDILKLLQVQAESAGGDFVSRAMTLIY